MLLTLEGDGPLYLQVYRALCRAIEEGRFPPKTRLPGSRTLAQALGVSRTVVLQAFAQLDSEGITVGTPGSGTYVRARDAQESKPVLQPVHKRALPDPWHDRLPSPSPQARRMLDAMPPSAATARVYATDLLDFTDSRTFQDAVGQRRWRRTLVDAQRAREEESQDVLGAPSLRRALASVLRHERGLQVAPEDIVIVAGIQQARDLIARVLISPGTVVGIEEPGYRGVRASFAAHGAELVPCAVDEDGFDIGAHAHRLGEAKVVHVMPAHQFPSGAVMEERRRHALLEWSYRQGAYLVEDDFESEHRLVSRTLPPLYVLDTREHVIHIGAFAREFMPSLRLAYIVAPKRLRPFLDAAKWIADRGSGFFMQRVLARYLASGEYLRNLRRLFVLLDAQHRYLLDSLRQHLGEHVRFERHSVSGSLLLHLTGIPHAATQRFIDEAAACGVRVQSADVYYVQPPPHLTLLLRYAHMPMPLMDEAARRLAMAWAATLASMTGASRANLRRTTSPVESDYRLPALSAAASRG